MAGKFFVLRQVADFAPGLFENTAVEGGCVQLGHRGGGYVPAGQYTSLPFAAEAFFSLVPSWNADCPPGTTVEMQVRVSVDGSWSKWFSFGRWSAYIDRAAPTNEEDDLAGADGEVLRLKDGQPAATVVQMRVLLATEDSAATPQVRLMALSTDAPQQMDAGALVFERDLELPAYSCLTRDPAVAGRIAGATALTMMMNRRGRDLLPEEVARAAYDSAAARYGNLAFLCAAAGLYGFAARVVYAGIPALRRQVWQGHPVAARVHYRAPALDGTPGKAENGQAGRPVLKGAVTGSTGHLVAVRGFVQRDGQEHVVFHDPMAPTDAEVHREIPLSDFAHIYTGMALMMAEGGKGAGSARPRRRLVQLEAGADRFCLKEDGAELPVQALTQTAAPLTLCYTLSENMAYASAAQHRFYYPTPDEAGHLHFDRAAAEGRKMTVYLLAARGQSWVGEKRLEKTQEAKQAESGKEDEA